MLLALEEVVREEPSGLSVVPFRVPIPDHHNLALRNYGDVRDKLVHAIHSLASRESGAVLDGKHILQRSSHGDDDLSAGV